MKFGRLLDARSKDDEMRVVGSSLSFDFVTRAVRVFGEKNVAR